MKSQIQTSESQHHKQRLPRLWGLLQQGAWIATCLGFKLSCPLIDNAESIFQRLIHGTTNAIRSTAMASDDDGPNLHIRGRRRSNAISQPYSPVAVPSTSDLAGADVPDVTYFERTAEQQAEYRALITNQIAQF